ncbi:hypothetical protein ACIBCA_28240 [Kitasatospora sp. NPDC051170]|uniref:hypothetical protein n=1 Tax=Kitasatospora sp. NPDC051170 TaxID=3364056 RepID=UPI00378BC85C
MNAHHPLHPTDPAILYLSRREITELIVELRTEGREFGILWPSAAPGEADIAGQRLISLGNVPASTVINLLAVLREFKRGRDGGRGAR